MNKVRFHYIVLFFPALLLALMLSCPAYAQTPEREKLLDIKEVSTPGGLTAWLVEDHSLPIIAIDFAFDGAGAALDPVNKQGRAQLLSNTLDEGAGDYDSQSFQKALSDHSISLSFGSSRDHFSGSLKTLTRYKDKAFELTRLALTKPRFDKEPVERMRDANIARLRSSLSKPEWLAARIMNDVGFGDHPYALNSGGTLTTLRALTTEDLRFFKDNYLTRDRLKIAVSGDITAEELPAVLDDIFGGLPQNGAKTETEDLSIQNGGQIFVYEKDMPQTVIRIWQDGIDHSHPDYHAAQVMNFILGGAGFGSRLMEEVREKRGLTYGIYTGLQTMEHADIYSVGTSTRNETVNEVLGLIKKEWKKMRTEPVSEKELADAQSYLIGSLPLSLSSTDRISGLMLGLMLDNLPIDYLDRRAENIRNITQTNVQNAAQNLLTPDKLTTVLVGKPENIENSRKIETLPHVE